MVYVQIVVHLRDLAMSGKIGVFAKPKENGVTNIPAGLEFATNHIPLKLPEHVPMNILILFAAHDKKSWTSP